MALYTISDMQRFRCLRSNEQIKLHDTLQTGRFSKATCTVDKVFGILGLLGLVADNDIPVNYKVSVRTTYTRACEYIILNEGACIVLSYAGSQSKEAGLPTWVPNWDSHDTSSVPIASLSTILSYNAGTRYRLRCRKGWEDGSIILGGLIVDQIDLIGPILVM